MKRHNDSLYWQNMQLYAWGVLVNGLGLSLADARVGFRVRPDPVNSTLLRWQHCRHTAICRTAYQCSTSRQWLVRARRTVCGSTTCFEDMTWSR